MTTIHTIGYQRKPLSVFIGQLRSANVDAIIDVRLRNTSHLAGYTKKDTLAFLLIAGFDIAYEHFPQLAPSGDMFEAYRKEGKQWATYQDQILSLLKEREAELLGQEILSRYKAPCLLCAEPTAQFCHRRVVAEYWASHMPGLEIIHL